MVAPHAETILTFGPNRKVVGIVLSCPECDRPLRCEVPEDYPVFAWKTTLGRDLWG